MVSATQATMPVDALRTCADQVSRTLAIARNLVQAGKQVDLTGLDAELGFVCARALDLPPEEGRVARPILMMLRSELEALADAIELSGPHRPCRSPPCPGGPEAAC